MAYVKEAIENQRLGLEIKPQRITKDIVVPDELKALLKSNTELNTNFKALTQGKQGEY